MRKVHILLVAASFAVLQLSAQTTTDSSQALPVTPVTPTQPTTSMQATTTTSTTTTTRMAMPAAGQSSAKVVYIEGGGPGLLSVNYDMRFTPTQDGLGFRAGFGGFSLKNSSLIFVPIGLNWITSKNQEDYFEAAIGGTIVSNSNKEAGDGPFKNSFGWLSLGYRKQPANGGFFWKAALVPVVGKGFFFPYYAAAGAGYTF